LLGHIYTEFSVIGVPSRFKILTHSIICILFQDGVSTEVVIQSLKIKGWWSTRRTGNKAAVAYFKILRRFPL